MKTTAALRQAWAEWECKEARMVLVDFGPDRIRVVPSTKDAWTALAQVMAEHDYRIRPADTDSYNCRRITGGTGLSLHSYGIALDVNWDTNPYLKTPDGRKVRYSSRRTQEARGEDVKHGTCDTDMTEAMIEDIRAIMTVDQKAVFGWGGDFKTSKDAMHFQIDLTPTEMARGIDWSTHTVTVAVAEESTAAFVRRGDFSPEVEYYQRKLARLSPKSPGTPDGKYGKGTAESVVAFQKSRSPQVREGTKGEIIGPWTRDELDIAEIERVMGA
jgi:hypothetical protein